MGIVEFAEEFLGYKLLTFQKEFLNKCYETISKNKKLYYIPPRGNVKWMPLVIQYIALTYYLEENELNKGDKDEQ